MGDPAFGYSFEEGEEPVRIDVLESLQNVFDKVESMNSIETQLFIREHYEINFGVYRHNDPNDRHPLSLVLMNWNEDAVTHGPMRELMTQFADAEVGRFFNISWNEFLQLPHYDCENMIEVCKAKIAKEAPQQDAALKALSDLKGGK